MVAALEPALDANWLIGRTLEARGRAHPLAVLVTTRQVHDQLVWALTGHRPSWLLGNHAGAGHGRPGLGAPERRAIFTRLRELAEGRHNLIAWLIDAGQIEQVGALVGATLTAYRDYAALAGADVPRATRDLAVLTQQLLGAGLTTESANAQQSTG